MAYMIIRSIAFNNSAVGIVTNTGKYYGSIHIIGYNNNNNNNNKKKKFFFFFTTINITITINY